MVFGSRFNFKWRGCTFLLLMTITIIGKKSDFAVNRKCEYNQTKHKTVVFSHTNTNICTTFIFFKKTDDGGVIWNGELKRRGSFESTLIESSILNIKGGFHFS